MPRICVVSYYGVIEFMQSVHESLTSAGMTVFDFPMFRYYQDHHDKREDYADYFIRYLNENQIEYVLWWFVGIPTVEFKRIKLETGCRYFLFNWDEPNNWNDVDMVGKMSSFDSVFVTCSGTIHHYLDAGCKNAACLYPGFNPRINYPIKDFSVTDFNKYSCDISFCCTNLYEKDAYPHQFTPRRVIVDAIYQGQETYGYVFYLYGPAFLGEIYPQSYRGFVSYSESNRVFNYSKINLCTHVRADVDGYLNERVILVGGSGGLLLVDPIAAIDTVFDPHQEIVLIDTTNIAAQIREILDQYDLYLPRRKNFHKKCIHKYTYDLWAKTIVDVCHNNY